LGFFAPKKGDLSKPFSSRDGVPVENNEAPKTKKRKLRDPKGQKQVLQVIKMAEDARGGNLGTKFCGPKKENKIQLQREKKQRGRV